MFEEAYCLYAREMYRYALARLGSREDAEDVVSTVFCEWLAATHYEDRGFARAWLYVRLQSRIKDQWRQWLRRGRARLEEITDWEERIGVEDAPDERVIDRVVCREMLQATPLLPLQRHALHAYAVGEKLEETAVYLGRTKNAVKALRARGKERLRAGSAERASLL